MPPIADALLHSSETTRWAKSRLHFFTNRIARHPVSAAADNVEELARYHFRERGHSARFIAAEVFCGLTAAVSAAVIRLPTICDECRSSSYQDNPQPIGAG
jgi:hypothetical protein